MVNRIHDHMITSMMPLQTELTSHWYPYDDRFLIIQNFKPFEKYFWNTKKGRRFEEFRCKNLTLRVEQYFRVNPISAYCGYPGFLCPSP